MTTYGMDYQQNKHQLPINFIMHIIQLSQEVKHWLEYLLHSNRLVLYLFGINIDDSSKLPNLLVSQDVCNRQHHFLNHYIIQRSFYIIKVVLYTICLNIILPRILTSPTLKCQHTHNRFAVTGECLNSRFMPLDSQCWRDPLEGCMNTMTDWVMVVNRGW